MTRAAPARLLGLACVALTLGAAPFALAQTPAAVSPRGQAWWADIAAIAGDKNQGRQTGRAAI